ncbi:putative Translation initiation factor IF-2 [Heracleum sosnowskyi]|uniref:Translation initiation factor IF-2 n=1 Tax=Heracleum sosnowskyi TaxID=360622 RepID=A0AAD8GW82_9APIA|nr:putative Translation initiation factor IF-2 [Heracleum sosnowskyi]
MGEAEGKITLKLLVDRNAKRVLFGEAGKEFVDFLFHFLSLPVGTVVKLLSKDKMVGSLGKIYGSIEAMHANYMEPNVNKEHVLNPKVSSSSLANSPFLLGYKTDDEANGSKVFYRCSRQYNCSLSHVTTDPQVVCPLCGHYMNTELVYVHGPGKEVPKVEIGSGYVKGLVTYMVMDNLIVKPMSTISSITLLSTFKVKDLSALETLEVCIGKKEAVEMLRASFVTDKVLSYLFLGNQKA